MNQENKDALQHAANVVSAPAVATPSVTPLLNSPPIAAQIGGLLHQMVREYVVITCGPELWDDMKLQLTSGPNAIKVEDKIHFNGIPILRNPVYDPRQFTIQFGGFCVFYNQNFAVMTPAEAE